MAEELSIPQDMLWHLPDAMTAQELAELRAAVSAERGRELNWRALFVDGTPEDLAREAKFGPNDRLYVAGGDGSLHAAVAGLLSIDDGRHRLPEIALLPRGTGNDFARALHLPWEDWSESVRFAVNGHVRHCDLGYLNDKVFVNAVTMGFGAEATRDIPPGLKEIAGGVGYAAVTVWKAIGAEPFDLAIVGEDQQWEGEALALIVLNGNSIGGGARLGLESRLDDGNLDVAVLPVVHALDLPELLGDWWKEDPSLYEHLHYLQSPRFEITVSREIALSIDGEPSAGSRFSCRAEARALRFVGGD